MKFRFKNPFYNVAKAIFSKCNPNVGLSISFIYSLTISWNWGTQNFNNYLHQKDGSLSQQRTNDTDGPTPDSFSISSYYKCGICDFHINLQRIGHGVGRLLNLDYCGTSTLELPHNSITVFCINKHYWQFNLVNVVNMLKFQEDKVFVLHYSIILYEIQSYEICTNTIEQQQLKSGVWF